MTQREFEKRIKNEKLKMIDYDLEIGTLMEAPCVIGIYNDNGTWKIYKTEERNSTPYICEEFANEDTAFDDMYERVKSQIKMENL